jgi:hypothetical protein
MNLTRKRLVGVAAALSTAAVAAPLLTANAATAAPVAPIPSLAAGWGASIGLPLTGGAVVWQPPAVLAPAVIGPTIITTAPSSFINTNNQVSAGGNVSGGQFAP